MVQLMYVVCIMVFSTNLFLASVCVHLYAHVLLFPQSRIQGFCSKVSTIVENLILTGEGEELVLYVCVACEIHMYVISAVLYADTDCVEYL